MLTLEQKLRQEPTAKEQQDISVMHQKRQSFNGFFFSQVYVCV